MFYQEGENKENKNGAFLTKFLPNIDMYLTLKCKHKTVILRIKAY